MKFTDLLDYAKWLETSPATVLGTVIAHGGWSVVFPTGVPVWASRVRNYFNVTPRQLKRVDEAVAKLLVQKHHRDKRGLAGLALSGNVYVDEMRRIWFEMHTGGAAYHYEGEVVWQKKVKGAVTPQAHIPVFKLVSPDGSGGSREVCVHNWQRYTSVSTALGGWLWECGPLVTTGPLYTRPSQAGTKGEKRIGAVGKFVGIQTKVVINEQYKGSYNYSETIVKGFDAHELRDVTPHNSESGFYLNPPQYSALEARTFPKNDRSGRELAKIV